VNAPNSSTSSPGAPALDVHPTNPLVVPHRGLFWPGLPSTTSPRLDASPSPTLHYWYHDEAVLVVDSGPSCGHAICGRKWAHGACGCSIVARARPRCPEGGRRYRGHYLSPSSCTGARQEEHRTIDVKDARVGRKGDPGQSSPLQDEGRLPTARPSRSCQRRASASLSQRPLLALDTGARNPSREGRGTDERGGRVSTVEPRIRDWLGRSLKLLSLCPVRDDRGPVLPRHMSTPTASRGHVSILVLNDDKRPSTGEASAS
jgi:hypothetical protein